MLSSKTIRDAHALKTIEAYKELDGGGAEQSTEKRTRNILSPEY